MKLSLRVKLSAAFLAVTLLLFLIVSVFANGLLERQFKDYIIGNQSQKISDTVSLISTRYNEWGGKWDVNGIEVVGMNALGEGLILRVEDSTGKTVWDAKVHNGGMCVSLIEHMAVNMQSYSKSFKGGYVEKPYPVILKGAAVGTVHVGYYGPYFFSDNDIRFLATLNSLLVWAAVISALGALLFGVIMARQLTRPISHVILAADRIAKGDFNSRVKEKSTTTEIIKLTGTINSLAETLDRQDALRKRLTADVAHELRTPLATLQSHLEAMIDGIWQPDIVRLASCHEETVRISKLVGDLEKLTKYEGENLVPVRKPFDLSVLLKRIATNFEGPFKNGDIALEYEPEEIIITADEDKLSQVFINLLSNALKYTPSGGTVKISTACHDGTAEVRINDNGIGIAEEDLPHIFERFYRTDLSRSRATGGSGIGLTIAKSIVDAHGGSISVASQVGVGSVFTVTLPVE